MALAAFAGAYWNVIVLDGDLFVRKRVGVSHREIHPARFTDRVGLVLLFAFAQAVHYGIWLRLIPEEDRPQPSPRTFSASARALHRDMGTPMLFGATVLILGFAFWALLDLAHARISYLRLALFHGHLELAGLAFLFVEGYSKKSPQSSS